MDYKHFMYKEILEQPETFEKILKERKYEINEIAEKIIKKKIDSIYFIGCGSSYYASQVGSFYISNYTNLYTNALPSSEFIYYKPSYIKKGSLLVFLSRSGETTETVKALKYAKKLGLETLAISNNPNSSLAKEAKYFIDINAGEEKSVVMTKTFSGSILILQLLAFRISMLKRNKTIKKFLNEIEKLPNYAKQLIKNEEEKIKEVVNKYNNYKIIFLGSGPNYPISLESALKLRETSYLMTEAFHVLEFRHGPMAEVDEKTLIIIIAPKGIDKKIFIDLMKDIKNKNGEILAITNTKEILKEATISINLPEKILEEISPSISVIPNQLFAYYTSIGKGYDPDNPRHLSKVVKLP
ncbi:MAG: SIS domain-containing protein [Nitrososphaerota archaeon]